MNFSPETLRAAPRLSGLFGFAMGSSFDDTRRRLGELQTLGFSPAPGKLPPDRMVVIEVSGRAAASPDGIVAVALNFRTNGRLGMVSVLAGGAVIEDTRSARTTAVRFRDAAVAAFGRPAFSSDFIDRWSAFTGRDHPFGDAPYNACWVLSAAQPGPASVDELVVAATDRTFPMAHVYVNDRPVDGGRAVSVSAQVWN